MDEEKKEAEAEEGGLEDWMCQRRMALLSLDPEALCEALQKPALLRPVIEFWDEARAEQVEGHVFISCHNRWEGVDLVLRIAGPNLPRAPEGCPFPMVGHVVLKPVQMTTASQLMEAGVIELGGCDEFLSPDAKIHIEPTDVPRTFEIGPGEEKPCSSP